MITSSLPLTRSFKAEYLEHFGVLPLEVSGGYLRVAAAGAPPIEVLEDLEQTFSAPVELVEADASTLADAIRMTFAAAESTDSLVQSLGDDRLAGEQERGSVLEADARDLANQPPVVKYVSLLIREAAESRASDVHVEATDGGPVVRFRVDGKLTAATAPPRALQAAVISRLKLIAHLDIAERRAPQDGRIRMRFDHQDLDLRVSTVPTLMGESIVLRLLDHGGGPDGLDELGMPEGVHAGFVGCVRRSHGLVLASGPTGSGKTTTLYGALRLRDTPGEKIITVEDPVEYRLPGVTQVPVNVQAGMTFAASLRSILRQDPDVVMVGEMRDSETAKIAVQAAMTGHLVFSTVHTNDAAGAVARLIDLGIEPYLVAATLRGVLAQRLVRRVCAHCSDWQKDSALSHLGPTATGEPSVRRGEGCAVCRHTGFRGRIGIFEFLNVTDRVRAQIARSPDADALLRIASDEGFQRLISDGRAKVLSGLTTPQEVLRVVGE